MQLVPLCDTFKTIEDEFQKAFYIQVEITLQMKSIFANCR